MCIGHAHIRRWCVTFCDEVNNSLWNSLQTCLHLNTEKNTSSFFKLLYFSEKRIFSFKPQTRGNAYYQCCFCHHGWLKCLSGNTGTMQKIWKQKTLLWQALICISTGTLVPSLLWYFFHHFFSISICSQWKSSENNFNTASTENVMASHTL